MVDQSKSFPLGSHVLIELVRRVPVLAQPKSAAPDLTSKPARRREFDDYPRRRKKAQTGIYLFDLGTRIRSINESAFDGLRLRLASEHDAPVRTDGNHDEYVELDTNPSNATSLSNDAARDAQNAALLGSRSAGSADAMDPLAEYQANGSGRKLPACMPIPFNAHTLRLSANLGAGAKRLTEDITFPSRLTSWARRTTSSRDALESWNDLNVADDVPFGAGKIDDDPANIQVRPIDIPGVDFYVSLNVNAANIRITSEPSYDGFQLGGFAPNKLEKVWLRPVPIIWQLRFFTWYEYVSNFQYSGGPVTALPVHRKQDVLVNFIGRMPIYPARPLRTTKATSATVASRQYARVLSDMILRTPGLQAKIDAADAAVSAPGLSSTASFTRGGHTWTRVAGASATVTKMNERSMARLQLTNASVRAGTLLGIISSGGWLYYIWKTTNGLIANGTADLLEVTWPANSPTDGVPVSVEDFALPPTAIYDAAEDGYAPVLNAHDASTGALTTNVALPVDGLKSDSVYQV